MSHFEVLLDLINFLFPYFLLFSSTGMARTKCIDVLYAKKTTYDSVLYKN